MSPSSKCQPLKVTSSTSCHYNKRIRREQIVYTFMDTCVHLQQLQCKAGDNKLSPNSKIYA